ncbi:MAG: ATP synthase F1 subunit epsilon [Anaerolineaceae bacterium]|nr:ATP synthase F1 subunit epsilon [Anaerolineaceae bacterium]
MSICCEIVTQDKIVYDGGADMVILPGVSGVMGILPNHAPLLSLLKTGMIAITINGKDLYFSVKGGIVEVQPDQVTVLTDGADDARDMDLSAIEIEISKTKELLEQTAKTDKDTIRTLLELQRYLEVKVKAVNKYQSRILE